MKEKIEKLIKKLEDKSILRSHRFIPYIIKSLKKMLYVIEYKGNNLEELKIIAGGIGRIISDDYDFMTSSLGDEIGEICREIYRM